MTESQKVPSTLFQKLDDYLKTTRANDSIFGYKLEDMISDDSVKFTLYLKYMPSYTISDVLSMEFFEEVGDLDTDDGKIHMDIIIRDNKNSLINKHDEEVIKWSTEDNKINKRYNTESLLFTSESGYFINWNDIKVSADECLYWDGSNTNPWITASGSYTLTTNDPIAKSDKMKCSACADTGVIDSYVYGSWPCTACNNDIQEKEELSVWDKKLKEELDNGDDTWGSIAKKYRK